MAKKENVVRPFKGNLPLRGDRLRYLEDTLRYMKRVENNIAELCSAVAAYASPTIIQKITDEKVNPVLFSTFCSFRLVSITEKFQLPLSTNMVKHFENTFNHNTTEEQNVYLSSRYDSDLYRWQDTTEVAKDFAKNCGLTDREFQEFSEQALLNKCFIGCSGSPGATNAISQIFGEGKKSDYQRKSEIAKIAADTLENMKPSTYESARLVVLNALGHKTIKDCVEDYGSSGAKSTFRIFMESREVGPITSEQLTAKIKKFREDEQKNSIKKALPHAEKIRKFLFGKFKEEYLASAWAEAWCNVMAEFNSKLSNNQIFVKGKIEIWQELEDIKKKNSQLLKAITMLNAWKSKNWDDNSTIAAYHIGDLKKFISIFNINSEGTFDERFSATWEEFSTSLEYGEKPPVQDLLRHIIKNMDDLTHAEIISAAKFLKLEDNMNNKYPHPFVMPNQGCLFGEHNLWGEINDPNMEIGSTKEVAGQRPMMWLTAKLLDNGKWVKHHLPFSSSRYFAEVYYTDPALPTLPTARDGKHSYKLGKNIDADTAKTLKNNPRAKAAKLIARVKANATHNVAWISPTFKIQQQNDQFVITINHRHPFIAPPKQMVEGDRILSFDQNETAPTCYAILEKTDNTGIPFCGHHMKVVKTGSLKAEMQTSKKSVDAFTYMGPMEDDHASGFPALLNICEKFISDNGDEKDIAFFSYKLPFERPLYFFHGSYFTLLKKMIKKAKNDPKKLKLIRDHLDEILFNNDLSPVRLHSLSIRSMESTKKVISAISSYFHIKECKTIEEQKNEDITLYKTKERLYKSLVNRRKERTKVSAGMLVRLARENGCRFMVGEGELPTQQQGKSKKNNNAKQDWCARDLAQRVEDMCEVVGIKWSPVGSHHTSHQNPFVYKNITGGKEYRCRYSLVKKSEMTDKMAVKIRNFLHAEPVGSTAYYRDGVLEFAKHHQLDLATMKKRRDAKYYVDNLPDEFLVPTRGGRIYLSDCPLGGNETVKINETEYFVNNSDQVAAINVGLVFLLPKKNQS